MELHLSLHVLDFEKSRSYVERAEEWLCRLLEANRKNRIRDEKAFGGVLFEVWRCLTARETELGLWMLKKFTRSGLFHARQQSSFSPSLFFCRANVVNGLEKTRAGRSFKRVARGVQQKVAGDRG